MSTTVSAASSSLPSAAASSAKAQGSTSSAASPKPTHSSTSLGSTVSKSVSSSSLLDALFPVSNIVKSWTTAADSSDSAPLSDATLQPTKDITSLSHDYVSAPDGRLAMQAHYPEGSYTFGHDPQGGISFYATGPSDVDLTTAKEATLGYSVYFEEDFAWNMGGKLPGLYGGDSDEDATSCSGGARSDTCFSARLMWRTDGAGELYTYLPPMTEPQFAANKVQCSVAPKSLCNDVYGASVGRGAYHFAAGQWTTVSQRVRLNTVGKADGELELFVNGQSVINVSGLILTASSEGRIRGIMMQTFFGGHTSEYASPKDQNAYFSDFSVAITETF